MALLGSKRLHLIVTDSRGKGLGDLIKERNKTGELFDVLVRDGAALLELVDVASQHLQKSPFDVVYIAGGACDITHKEKGSGRILYTWGEGDTLEQHLQGSLLNAITKLEKDLPASKVIFCPMIASELKRVVNYGGTTTNDQTAVERAVWGFNNTLFKINRNKKLISPSLHHQVHRFCKGKKRNYYHHLNDGLHLTDYLKSKWADEFVTVMAHN